MTGTGAKPETLRDKLAQQFLEFRGFCFERVFIRDNKFELQVCFWGSLMALLLCVTKYNSNAVTKEACHIVFFGLLSFLCFCVFLYRNYFDSESDTLKPIPRRIRWLLYAFFALVFILVLYPVVVLWVASSPPNYPNVKWHWFGLVSGVVAYASMVRVCHNTITRKA